MTTEARLLTGEEFAALEIEELSELVEGRLLIMPRPKNRHSASQSRLSRWLGNFGEERRLGQSFVEFGMYTRRDPDTIRFPDVAFLSYERWPGKVLDDYSSVAPELVVEIISPSNTWREMWRKVAEYFDAGVEAVWIVDPELRSALVFRTLDDFSRLTDGDTLRGEGVLGGFELAVTALFDV